MILRVLLALTIPQHFVGCVRMVRLCKSADLGGRVGWFQSVFFFARRAKEGGRGGIPCPLPSRPPPPRQPFQPSPTPSPASRQETFSERRKMVWQPLWCPGPWARAPRPWRPRPQGPGGPGPKPWDPGPAPHTP